MRIIAHRGWWQNNKEKNSMISFQKAFLNGYVVETDLRDYCGQLVISHNVADCNSVLSEELFELYRQYGNNVPLALNIKSDGIQDILREQLEKYKVTNYFVFDMSVPEMVIYKQKNFQFFTRSSDIEKECVLYQDASGIWMDTFYDDDWKLFDSAKEGLNAGKCVAAVSPELHGKSRQKMWDRIKQEHMNTEEAFYLCTDYPEEAKYFFEKE